MNSIELMVLEHKYIKRMLLVMRKACYKIIKGNDICYEDFNAMIDFIRNYADAHHHGKEEKFLFKEMVDKLGNIADTLINHGMLVEHNLGRLYISQLNEALSSVKDGNDESKLDVISNAVGYADLLARHIGKEDEVVYTFAERKLSEETINNINEMSDKFEQEAKTNGTQEYYITLLGDLEKKYLT